VRNDPLAPDPAALERLAHLCAHPAGPRGWSDEELLAFPRLYRRACTELAALEEEGRAPRRAAELAALVGRAHALLHRMDSSDGEPVALRLWRLFSRDAPRAVRAEWRLVVLTLVLVYGLAAGAWFAVARDLDLAYSLLAPEMVAEELEQLAALEDGQPFRGNFTFGLGESPVTASWIMLHNIGIGILFFASALVPPFYLYLISTNGLMLGTYTAVAGHHGQAGAISSILWTHGVLEIQALILAGTAGLVLVRAFLRPGARTRALALTLESRRALCVFAPVFPLLVCAGLIEGFVSPHAPGPVRLAVAIASGIALIAWAGFAGRGGVRAS
jgi:uncharacterized membrane protein SpoIIM required for sporulation